MAVGVLNAAIRQPWWARSAYSLDGIRPLLAADFSRQRYMRNGAVVPFSSIITLSSASKWVVNQSGVLVNVPANTPAFDYSTGRGRLVLEGASTNLFPSSTSPTSWNIGSGLTRNSVSTVAGITMGSYTFLGTGNAFTNLSVSVSANTTYTASYYSQNQIAVGNNFLFLDPATRAINYVGTQLANGLWRYVATFTTAASNETSVRFGIGPFDAAANYVMTVGGPQLELQSFASSYIPTTSSSITRAADAAQLTSTAAALLQASTATVVVRAGQLRPLVSGSGYNARILGGPSIDSYADYNAGSSNLECFDSVNSASVSWTPTQNYGVVHRHNSTPVASVTASGSSVGSNSTWNNSGFTSVYLGTCGSPNAANPAADGYYDELVIWPIYGSNAGTQNQARVWQ